MSGQVPGPLHPSRDAAIDAAAQVLLTSDDAIAQMTPAEQARAAWHPGSRKSVADLEAEIRVTRGLTSPVRGPLAPESMS